MAGLPAAMLAKRVKLEANIPVEPTAKVVDKPVAAVLPTSKKEEPAVELDIAQFAVDGPDDSSATEVSAPEPNVIAQPVKPVAVSEEDDPAQWKWKYKTLKGNHDLLVQENKEMRVSLVKLEERVDNLSKEKPKASATDIDSGLDLSEDEIGTYGGSIPVIEKLATKKAKLLIQEFVAPLQEEIKQLRENTKDTTTRMQTAHEHNFLQQVKMQVDGFDDIIKTPQWKEFTNKPAGPYAETTIGQAVWEAHHKEDLGTVVKIFKDFSKSISNPIVDAHRGIPVSGAPAPLPSSGKKPILKLSERTKVSQQFRKNQITLEKYNAIKQLYAEAEAEGRIDYTK